MKSSKVGKMYANVDKEVLTSEEFIRVAWSELLVLTVVRVID